MSSPHRSDRSHSPKSSDPLISRVTNAWQNSPDQKRYEEDFKHFPPRGFAYADGISPRWLLRRVWKATKWVSRFAAVLLLLYITIAQVNHTFVRPWVAEDRAFRSGLDKAYAGYGNQSPSRLGGVTLVRALDARHLPGGEHDRHGAKRLVFVGDIHGCLVELNKLLDAVQFDPSKDHLIHTGDVIAKGPNSAGVIDRLISLNASGVRGNWEDRLLTAHAVNTDLRSFSKPKWDPVAKTIFSATPLRPSKPQPTEQPERLTGNSPLDPSISSLKSQLQPHHLRYLTSLPVILTITALPSSSSHHFFFSPPSSPTHPLTDITTPLHTHPLPPLAKHPLFVVHAGLVPAVPLSRQDPVSAMTMRHVDPETHLPLRRHRYGTVRWTKLWGWYQTRLARGVAPPRVAVLPDDRDEVGTPPRAAGPHESVTVTRHGPERVLGRWARALAEVLGAVGWGAAGGWVERSVGTQGWRATRRVGGPEGSEERWREREGEMWEAMKRRERPGVVVYGHNSKDGVRVERWSLGVDGGCVGGGRLVALVLDAKGRRELVSVKCGNYLGDS